jgi:hypothetical protein
MTISHDSSVVAVPDASGVKLDRSGLLHLTARIAAELFVSRAGEPVDPGSNERRYDVQDAVTEAAGLLTYALTPELVGEAYRLAANTFGVGSFFEMLVDTPSARADER